MDLNKTILVTGGTGSLGQRICDILHNKFNPKKLIIFSRDENKQFKMALRFNPKNTRFIIGDIRDKSRLLEAVEGVNIIIHAAALKQIPQAEYNPFEYVKTNILGSQNVIEVAKEAEVKKVIHTTTDKSVNLTNNYGATKFCADKLFIAANYYLNNNSFSCIRMGNIIGSTGSIIPIFNKMGKKGKIILTDPKMTRFWMTLDNAANFLLNRLIDMKGGEIFVPKTPTMKLVEIIEAVAPNCDIEIIGKRPGEKVDEILISEHEVDRTIEFENYYVVLPYYKNIKDYLNETNGKLVNSDFKYTSSDISYQLSSDQLQSILKYEERKNSEG